MSSRVFKANFPHTHLYFFPTTRKFCPCTWGWDGGRGPTRCRPAGRGHPCPVAGLSGPHPAHKWCSCATNPWQICDAETQRPLMGCFSGQSLPWGVNVWITV